MLPSCGELNKTGVALTAFSTPSTEGWPTSCHASVEDCHRICNRPCCIAAALPSECYKAASSICAFGGRRLWRCQDNYDAPLRFCRPRQFPRKSRTLAFISLLCIDRPTHQTVLSACSASAEASPIFMARECIVCDLQSSLFS